MRNTVGYWQNATFPYLPDPHDYVDDSWNAHEREVVLQHLNAGVIQYAHLRAQQCHICGGSFGNNDITDGRWSWPEDLVHYVISHHVKPDAEFVAWVLEQAESRAATGG
jgi:hypothetical protein